MYKKVKRMYKTNIKYFAILLKNNQNFTTFEVLPFLNDMKIKLNNTSLEIENNKSFIFNKNEIVDISIIDKNDIEDLLKEWIVNGLNNIIQN